MNRFAVRRLPSKGRAVFARSPVGGGDLLWRDHVLIFANGEASARSRIHRYTFEWDDDTSAIALGLGSILNHSYSPNVIYRIERGEQRIAFRAHQDIRVGQELTINYNFDPDDRRPVGFKVSNR